MWFYKNKKKNYKIKPKIKTKKSTTPRGIRCNS